jgi:hypothetical protein
MTACHQHFPVEATPCNPEEHSQPSCPWCIVWRQKVRIDHLEKTLAGVHGLMVHGAQGLVDVLNPRLAAGSEAAPRGTGRAKRTRASKSSASATESAQDGSGPVAADTAGEP